MIQLTVDEGYAFDYLSILEVKSNMDTTKYSQFIQCRDNIAKEISTEKFLQIYNSQEYKDLYAANLQTFKLVDLAKTDQVTASAVDKANYNRYLQKIKIQTTFFNEPLKEVKLGYETYDQQN